jgi:hypothetical protein
MSYVLPPKQGMNECDELGYRRYREVMNAMRCGLPVKQGENKCDQLWATDDGFGKPILKSYGLRCELKEFSVYIYLKFAHVTSDSMGSSWSYESWIYNYLRTHFLSQLKL